MPVREPRKDYSVQAANVDPKLKCVGREHKANRAILERCLNIVPFIYAQPRPEDTDRLRVDLDPSLFSKLFDLTHR